MIFAPEKRALALGCCVALACLVFVGAPTLAWSSEDEEHEQHSTHGEEVEHGSGGGHKNEFAVFLGITDEGSHGTEYTSGLEYERLISDHWGIGGLIDYAGGDFRNLLVMVPVFYHPTHRWKLLVAPGIEFHNGRGLVEDHGHRSLDKDERYFVIRLGVAYGIPLGKSFSVQPTVNLDLVDGEKVWVYGVNLGYAW
ncbi:MAG: hypothetical protein GY906_16805 [bacterium]|nr:hypothetical protein [bacterium]